MSNLLETLRDFFARGGWVMWPLGVLSVVSLTLILERAWFWFRNNHPASLRQVDELARLFRAGRLPEAAAISQQVGPVYRELVGDLMREKLTEAGILAAIQKQQRQMALFMPALGTIITAAPMLGILGTVTGIISAFQVLGVQTTATADPAQVGSGIAEALLTTVAGLVVALVTLFPYNLFRGQLDRTQDRLEMLVAAVECSVKPAGLTSTGAGRSDAGA